MGLKLTYNEGQTPIDEDEKEGLLVASISTREELNEFEQNNIEKAIQWTLKRKYSSEKILTEKFIKKLHIEMFGEVWKWAGCFRKTDKNIGVDKNSITVELKKLMDDTNFWIQKKTFLPDEIALRFKHRLVSIHLFPNGNGRHSRLMADIIISHIYNQQVFTWGSGNLESPSSGRKLYINSLRKADSGFLDDLIQFARS